MTVQAVDGATATAPRARAGHAARSERAGLLTPSGSPWSIRNLLPSAVLMAIGWAVVAICWVAVSGKAEWKDQVSWVGGTVVGAAVAAAGLALALLPGFRTLRAEERLMLHELRLVGGLPAVQSAGRSRRPGPVEEDRAPAAFRVLALPRLGLYHEPGCLLIVGKEANAITAPVDDHRANGLQPCKACVR